MTILEDRGASFSKCGKYRYTLYRVWDEAKPCITFVMLNPSTADAIQNDPTVSRCQQRAIHGGFGRLEVRNLFAFKSTNPAALYDCEDPVGPLNDKAIIEACTRSDLVICAWGKDGNLMDRHKAVLGMMRAAGVKPHALRLNKDGTPAHPLYLPYTIEPVLMESA